MLIILFVFLGMKITKNKQNAQNAHLVDNMSVESKKGDNNTMSKKLTGEQYRLLVAEKGQEVADAMASVLGVATQRVGKMKYAPKPVLEAWDAFKMTVEENLEEWNGNLPKGVDKIRTVDPNIKK